MASSHLHTPPLPMCWSRADAPTKISEDQQAMKVCRARLLQGSKSKGIYIHPLLSLAAP